MYLKIIFLLIIYLCESIRSSDDGHDRKKRALLFPGSSTIGILAALAIPIDLPHRNIFMSYNFEANYNSPYLGSDYIPGPLQRLDLIEGRSDDTKLKEIESKSDSIKNNTIKKSTIKTKRSNLRPSLLSRRKAYKIFEAKLYHYGLLGRPCLLRLICEINNERIFVHNGVLGNILHVIFSPTTSQDENLPIEYYKAELDGIKNNCQPYNQICSESILELFSHSYEIL